MAGVKLSDVIEALHGDSDIRKLAQEAGVAAPAAGAEVVTETPDSELTGESVEDEKAKIQTKLMELAGMETEAVSATKVEETTNVANKAPAGEKLKPVEQATAEVAPGGMPASPASQMSEVVASALGKMNPEGRKEACLKIIEKIASLNAVGLDDLKGQQKLAGMTSDEWDAAGRIMARAYADEMDKMAQELAQEQGTETAEASAESGIEGLSAEENQAIDELFA